MANKNRTGFYPVGTLTGAPWSASIRRYVANVTPANVCIGDLVKIDAAGKANLIGGTLLATDVTNVIGAIVGIEPVPRNASSVQGGSLTLERTYLQKATTGTQYVRVVTDPTTIYESVTVSAVSLGAANIGQSASIITLTGGTNTMAKTISSMCLDSASFTTGTNIFQIIDVPDYADNDTTLTNARVHVVLNTSPFNRGIGAR